MKRLFIGAIASLALVSAPVYADGYASLNVVGNNNATLGEITEIKVVIDDVKDTYEDKGIAAVGGDLVFDKEYLEFVSVEKGEEPYKFLMNEKIYRIAGLDLTLNNGIKNKTVIYTMKFKTLKEGNTNITFKNVEIVDTKNYVQSEINSLDLSIEAKTIATKNETTTTTTTTAKKQTTTTTATTAKKETTTTTTTTAKKETTTTTSLPKTTVSLENKENEQIEKEETEENLWTSIANFFKKLFENMF